MRPGGKVITHRCSAADCRAQIPSWLLFCPEDYKRLPRELRGRLAVEYRYGRDNRRHPTDEYLAVARECIAAVNAARARAIERAEKHRSGVLRQAAA